MSIDTIERPAADLRGPVAAADWKPAPRPPGQILSGAVDLMAARGRAHGSYELLGGQLCALGALAVAAGKDPDFWDILAGPEPYGHGDVELVEAARLLVQVIAPWHDADALMVGDLVEIVWDWHDGEMVEVDGKPTWPHPPLNSTVFDAFARAEPVEAAA